MKRLKTLFLLPLLCVGATLLGQSKTNHFLTTDDSTKLFVKKAGNGPICIFIHGGPGAWSKSFEVLKGNNLEANLSMVYYDQRGCGRSEMSASGDYSMERMVKDIDLIRQHYNASKVYLMSHSFGGILALNYTLKHPNYVKGLILVNSTLNMRYSIENQINYTNQLLNTNFTLPDSTASALMTTFRKARKALSQKKLNYKMLSDSQKNVDLVNKTDKLNPGDYDFAKHVFLINDYWKDYTPKTKQITLPVLVITGAKDHSIGEKHYLDFHFKNEKVKKINGGHILYYEKNKAFINAVFDFVKNTNKAG